MMLASLAVASALLTTGGGTWDERIHALASAREGVVVETIGASTQETLIRVVRAGPPKADAGAVRPMLLVVAGADAGTATGVEVALGLAESLAAHPPAWLDSLEVAIVPCLNPDAFASRRPLMDGGRLPQPTDADRDGRLDEDGGDDLDGDGMVLSMRVRAPAPATRLKATWCDDPDWPGLMRTPDAAKGEAATWALLIEGRDDDGDGRFNEDGRGGEAGGGIDLDRQWPASWPEFEDGAGSRPLQTSETRSLATWCLAQERLVGVLVFGRHDTLTAIPEPGKMEVSGNVPQGIAEPDKWIWELLGARFKDVSGITESPRADLRGSFVLWASSHLGLLSMGTPIWVRPDLVKPERRGESVATEQPSGEATARADTPAEGASQEPKGPEAKTDEAKWLRYFGERAAKGDAPGFVAWKPFEHPQLGTVEIGGFVPGARATAPASELPRLIAQQIAFIGECASLLPRLSEKAWATRLAPGLWRIDARLVNEGRLPTRTSMGAKAKWRSPTLMTLEVEASTLLSGRRVHRVETIGPGGVADASWTVRAADGGTLKVSVSDPTWGVRSIEVPLVARGAEVGGRP